ncbi:MAG: DUF126 domain-containing protein [Candidatus Marsarchaeota archaeon]
MKLVGKPVVSGDVTGEALVSARPISFLGGVEPSSGKVVDPNSDVKGEVVTGKVLIYPTGKGSTVGSYVIYAMKKMGTAPAAMLLKEADTVTIIGCVLAGIPLVHGFRDELLTIRKGAIVRVNGGMVEVGESRALVANPCGRCPMFAFTFR